jgi:hypothetical protein
MPFPPDFDARLATLHAKGLSRNQIATELGCSAGTVTNHARKLGLTFERTETAVSGRGADHRSESAQAGDPRPALRPASRRISTASSTHGYTYSLVLPGSAEDVARDHRPRPTTHPRQRTSGTTCPSSPGTSRAAVKLEQVDADGGESEVKSMLQRLGEELGIAQSRDRHQCAVHEAARLREAAP